MPGKSKLTIPKPKNPVNKQLDALASVQAKIKELQEQADRATEEIKEGLTDMVVVFIDMVGSTQFKLEHQDAPHKWILRVKQFSELISNYVTELGGKVVKYIGDEVMAVFDRDSRVHDAVNFVGRVVEIEENLRSTTGHETRIKVVVDSGPVYLLKYPGHNEFDPQGTPVDRAARIGKLAKPGTVLSSYDFVKQSPSHIAWSLLGNEELRGLGMTAIYQLGAGTFSLQKMVEVVEGDYIKLKNSHEETTLERNRLIEMNKGLQEQLAAFGQQPGSENSVVEEESEDDAWAPIQKKIDELDELISEAKVPKFEYARFLFLDQRGESQRWDSYAGRTFEATLERDLAIEKDGGFYVLNGAAPRNIKAKQIMQEIEEMLRNYENEHGVQEGHLFAYSLQNADFWNEIIGVNVS